MFELSLQAKFKRIFDVVKVSYDQPSSTDEQDVLFIQIDDDKTIFRDGTYNGHARGRAMIFSRNDKMPMGYLSKRIQQADLADTKDLYFSETGQNTKVFQNIVQRGFSFVYFFNGQYDPEIGTITSLTTEVTT